MPIGIDAVMRIEAAVLDGDEGLRQIGRQILQRDIGAGHFAARAPARCRRGRRSGWSAAASEFPATGSAADARRPRPRRRPPRSRPTGRAPRPNRPGVRCRSAPRDFDRRLLPLRLGARLALARRLVVVVVVAICAWRMLSSACRRRPGMRSCGIRRNSASAAASPNCGSLRPPLFFRPHAIRKRRSHPPAAR